MQCNISIVHYSTVVVFLVTGKPEIPTWLQISHVMFPFLSHHLCMHFLCANCIQPTPVDQHHTVSIFVCSYHKIISGHMSLCSGDNQSQVTCETGGRKNSLLSDNWKDEAMIWMDKHGPVTANSTVCSCLQKRTIGDRTVLVWTL